MYVIIFVIILVVMGTGAAAASTVVTPPIVSTPAGGGAFVGGGGGGSGGGGFRSAPDEIKVPEIVLSANAVAVPTDPDGSCSSGQAPCPEGFEIREGGLCGDCCVIARSEPPSMTEFATQVILTEVFDELFGSLLENVAEAYLKATAPETSDDVLRQSKKAIRTNGTKRLTAKASDDMKTLVSRGLRKGKGVVLKPMRRLLSTAVGVAARRMLAAVSKAAKATLRAGASTVRSSTSGYFGTIMMIADLWDPLGLMEYTKVEYMIIARNYAEIAMNELLLQAAAGGAEFWEIAKGGGPWLYPLGIAFDDEVDVSISHWDNDSEKMITDTYQFTRWGAAAHKYYKNCMQVILDTEAYRERMMELSLITVQIEVSCVSSEDDLPTLDQSYVHLVNSVIPQKERDSIFFEAMKSYLPNSKKDHIRLVDRDNEGWFKWDFPAVVLSKEGYKHLRDKVEEGERDPIAWVNPPLFPVWSKFWREPTTKVVDYRESAFEGLDILENIEWDPIVNIDQMPVMEQHELGQKVCLMSPLAVEYYKCKFKAPAGLETIVQEEGMDFDRKSKVWRTPVNPSDYGVDWNDNRCICEYTKAYCDQLGMTTGVFREPSANDDGGSLGPDESAEVIKERTEGEVKSDEHLQCEMGPGQAWIELIFGSYFYRMFKKTSANEDFGKAIERIVCEVETDGKCENKAFGAKCGYHDECGKGLLCCDGTCHKSVEVGGEEVCWYTRPSSAGEICFSTADCEPGLGCASIPDAEYAEVVEAARVGMGEVAAQKMVEKRKAMMKEKNKEDSDDMLVDDFVDIFQNQGLSTCQKYEDGVACAPDCNACVSGHHEMWEFDQTRTKPSLALRCGREPFDVKDGTLCAAASSCAKCASRKDSLWYYDLPEEGQPRDTLRTSYIPLIDGELEVSEVACGIEPADVPDGVECAAGTSCDRCASGTHDTTWRSGRGGLTYIGCGNFTSSVPVGGSCLSREQCQGHTTTVSQGDAIGCCPVSWEARSDADPHTCQAKVWVSAADAKCPLDPAVAPVEDGFPCNQGNTGLATTELMCSERCVSGEFSWYNSDNMDKWHCGKIPDGKRCHNLAGAGNTCDDCESGRHTYYDDHHRCGVPEPKDEGEVCGTSCAAYCPNEVYSRYNVDGTVANRCGLIPDRHACVLLGSHDPNSCHFCKSSDHTRYEGSERCGRPEPKADGQACDTECAAYCEGTYSRFEPPGGGRFANRCGEIPDGSPCAVLGNDRDSCNRCESGEHSYYRSKERCGPLPPISAGDTCDTECSDRCTNGDYFSSDGRYRCGNRPDCVNLGCSGCSVDDRSLARCSGCFRNAETRDGGCAEYANDCCGAGSRKVGGKCVLNTDGNGTTPTPGYYGDGCGLKKNLEGRCFHPTISVGCNLLGAHSGSGCISRETERYCEDSYSEKMGNRCRRGGCANGFTMRTSNDDEKYCVKGDGSRC